MTTANPGTDLVPSNGGGLTPEELASANATIAKLAADGDIGALGELAGRAEALGHLYRKRQGYDEQANVLLSYKIRCEAEIGLLDIQRYPRTAVGQPPLVAESPTTRNAWRHLAVALDRGRLDALIAEVAASDMPINTENVRSALRRNGYGAVPVSAFQTKLAERRKGVEKHHWGSGKVWAAIADEADTTSLSVQRIANGQYASVGWWVAKRLALALDIDPYQLPARRQQKPQARQRRLWLSRRPKSTGGRWDEANVRLYKFLDEFGRLADNANPRYDPAYEHLYAVRDLIRKEMLRAA
jgi:hypothetical protein